MPDRRHYLRNELRSPVEFTGADPKIVTFGFAIDLSSGGAFVQTDFPARSGSSIVLRLWRPGWATELALPGVVRWARPGGMGIEFAPVGWREKGLIDDLVGDSLPAARAV
jgi:hypothetical protein